MKAKEINKLAEHIQGELHDNHLPGYYFDVEDVAIIIGKYYGINMEEPVAEVTEEKRYYLDYRCGYIREGATMNVGFVAPELYCEVKKNNEMHEIYSYVLEDEQGNRLNFTFTQQQVDDIGYQALADEHCKLHGFVCNHIASKLMYLNEDTFEGYLMKG